ncbi:MAG: glycoside hydrolase family 32 protein, partial [Melioribacteraceae bacterium]|nr:glycoside hydrolase family 32 protein [Melioribacteraceae bacterium]
DGLLYSQYNADNIDLLSSEENFVLFGIRHMGANGFVSVEIEDARIYDVALTQNQINSLKPNHPSEIDPYAWWDFEGEELTEKMGRYNFHNLGEREDVKHENGKLTIYRWGSLIAIRELKNETPEWPENPPDDWMTFHLAHPGPGIGEPGDPNPAYYHEGKYHLHYIYNSIVGFNYAHVSSEDMVYWNWHQTVLTPAFTGHGMFSGTGFFTKEGKPAMVYHGVGSGTNVITYALDDELDKWTKPKPIKPVKENGEYVNYREFWDPDLWLMGDTYYALSGGKNPPLMKSLDLENWIYLDDLLHKDYKGEPNIPRDEDISCANMFRIGNKWMLLCISHRLGCRYFLGDFINEKYMPSSHHMMNWVNTDWENGPDGLVYFAPESMLAEDGRRIMWAWIIGDIKPSAIQALPREIELPEDGILRIRPLRELEKLRYDEKKLKNISVKKHEAFDLKEIRGDAIELQINFGSDLPKEFGLNLFDENLKIEYGSKKESLSIGSINPPFKLNEDEELILRIFIDKNLVEVFANDRQAAVVSSGAIRKNPNIQIYTNDVDLLIKEIKSWKMKSIYK